jgi:hypothetical protein
MAYEDLLKDSSKPDPDNKNYFIVTITDLFVNKTYPIEFRWKYKDGSFGPWGAVKKVIVSSESVNTPSTPSVTASPGRLNVTWDGNDSSGNPLVDIDRINVLVGGVYYGSILKRGSAGSLSLPFSVGTYSVTFVAVSKLGNESSPSSSSSATITTDIGTANANLASKLEAGAGVVANASSQIVSIDTGSGLVVYSSSSTATAGNRVVLNSEGLAGFRVDGVNQNKASFAILTNTKYYDPTTEEMYTTTAPGRLTIDAGSGFFSGTLNAKAGVFSGAITVGDGTMQFGDNVSPAANKTGIYINQYNHWYDNGYFRVGSNNKYLEWDVTNLNIKGDIFLENSDYIYASGSFSFGTGILSGTSSAITININNGSSNFILSNMPASDNDGFAGDPTITIQPSGKLVKGRAMIFNSTTTPTSADLNWINKTFNQVNIGPVPIKVGDLILVAE